MPISQIMCAVIILMSVATACKASSSGDTALSKASMVRETSACENTTEWVALDTSGGAPKNVTISVTSKPGTFTEGSGAIQFDFIREPKKFHVFVRPVLLTDFKVLEFDIWSKEQAVFALTFEDRDNAAFHYPININAQKWKHVRVTPYDFKLNDDSKTKKAHVEQERLGIGLCLVDFSPAVGAKGPNTMRLDNLVLSRDPISVLNVPGDIKGRTVEITRKGLLNHAVVIGKGGKLRISAPRFELSSNIIVDSGTLEFANSVIDFKGRHQHDLGLVAQNGGTIRFVNCLSTSKFGNSLSVSNSRLEAIKSDFGGGNGFTVDVKERANVLLDDVKTMGEFIVSTDSTMAVCNSETVLIWATFGKDQKGELILPDGNEIKSWATPAQTPFKLSISNSKGILWGLISDSGSDVVVKNSTLLAVGIVFSSRTPATITGVKNGNAGNTAAFAFTDRRLQLPGTKVIVWNVYGGKDANIILKNCTIGECLAFENARVQMIDSTCDGSGGYVSSGGQADFYLKNCTINSVITATAQGKLTLEKCSTQGPLTASGDSQVKLLNTAVTNGVVCLDNARVERH